MLRAMKKTLFIILIFSLYVQAQNVTITPGGITPALTGTYQRLSYDAILALPSPVIGDQVFDTTFLCMRVYVGTRWVCTYQMPKEPVNDAAFIATAGGPSKDYPDVGESVAVDGSGNVYVTGSFGGTSTFGGISKTSGGESDIFVAKYNSNGVVQWVQSAGGSVRAYGKSIGLDAAGNVYVAGEYKGTATFGGISKISAGENDIFIAKYNSSGVVQWVQSAGGANSDSGKSLAVDDSGNSYLVGEYFGTASFGAIDKISAGSGDIFIAKYNSSGTIQWVESAGGLLRDIGRGVALDATGNVYVTGTYENTAAFGGGAINPLSMGGIDIFIAKFNASGVVQWVQSAGGNSFDAGYSIAIDTSDNVFVTGLYQETADFDGISLISAGNRDIFIAKYNSSGTVQWVQSAGGTLSDSGLSVAVDLEGNSYITGYYSDVATFGTRSGLSFGNSDFFVTKYNSSGNPLWLQCGGGTHYDGGSSLTVDTSGNVFVTGYFRLTASFGITSPTSAGESDDIFLARISQ
jgi:hypothetical protein